MLDIKDNIKSPEIINSNIQFIYETLIEALNDNQTYNIIDISVEELKNIILINLKQLIKK